MMASMKEFLITVGESAARTAGEAAEQVEARTTFARELGDTCRDAGRLRPSAQGKRVTKHAGKAIVTEGPFDAALDSYYVVSTSDVAEAARLAERCPGDDIEVRPVMGGKMAAGKLDEPGKVFACAVLGAAPNEQAWTAAMDRIEASRCAPPNFRGGVRLEAPTTGKRIKKGHVTDGPFLEAKEVIGGLFFVRMASIDEVVDWAKTSGFAEHGTLEIRELWRT